MSFKYFKIQALIPLIVVLAVFLQPISDILVEELSRFPPIKNAVPFVDALSTLGMISGVLVFINLQGWRWLIFRWLIDIPNLNGRYVGKLRSSFLTNGLPTEIDCVLEIRQTASAVHVNAYTGNISTGVTSSKSSTTSEQLIRQSSGFYELIYIFSNTPDTMTSQLNNHDGTARLTFFPDIVTLEGSYYNQRKNDGTIVVRRTGRKRLGRLKQ